MDFTLKIYQHLLKTLTLEGYSFITFEDYCEGKIPDKYVILRHDIDKLPDNALIIAKIDFKCGVQSSFYFRSSKSIFKKDIIVQLHNFSHEVGYHYRDLVESKNNPKLAIESFKNSLKKFRELVPVVTIAMDGSPLSKFDNRDLWKNYNYRDFGIIGEPYFDVNFDEVFYLTDTGRCWDGDKFSVRDKVKSSFTQSYHATSDIIFAAKNGTLPDKLMITTHPQRWTDNRAEWLLEWVMQNIKNVLKRIIYINS